MLAYIPYMDPMGIYSNYRSEANQQEPSQNETPHSSSTRR